MHRRSRSSRTAARRPQAHVDAIVDRQVPFHVLHCRAWRDTGETCDEFLTGLAEASGIETPMREDLARIDRTHFAHKAEHAADLETGVRGEQFRSCCAIPDCGASRPIELSKRFCAFVGTTGRCAERGFLEFHHVVPFADGGPATADNLQLRCRAHNLYEAQEHLAPLFVREAQGTFNSFPAERVATSRPREDSARPGTVP